MLEQLADVSAEVRQQALDEADHNHLTALHLAAYINHPEAAATLLEVRVTTAALGVCSSVLGCCTSDTC